MTDKLAFSITEAAALTPFSARTIDRATHATDPKSFPPPLRTKRAGIGPTAKRLILASELKRWLDSLPDA